MTEKNSDDTDAHISYRRIEIAMPVFDRRFNVAVVVATYKTVAWRRRYGEAGFKPELFDIDGIIKRPNFFSTGIAHVYRKKRGLWQLVHDEAFFRAE